MGWSELVARLLADPKPARIEAEGAPIGGRLVDAQFYNTPGLLALLSIRGLA